MTGRPQAWREPSDADAVRVPPALAFAAGERNHHVSNTAYPIAHETTWGSYRVPRARHEEVAVAAWEGIDEMCLYAHVPFCETRCSFCEYTVVGKDEAQDTGAYMRAMARELAWWRDRLGPRTLHGFDVGGGTPSFVDAGDVAALLEQVAAAFRTAPGFAVSIETTPRIAAEEPGKLRAWRRAGIGRVSMGVQVVQPDLLRVMNRERNGIDVHRRAVEHVRAAGFDRFNVDLMYGFAGQTLESWRATLDHAFSLAPEYVTLYRMRYKLTRVSHDAPRVTLDDVRAQAALAKEMLAAAGYRANPGKNTWSRLPGDPGTSAYLTRRVVDGMPYLGVGLGAQSFTHRTISYNAGSAGKTLVPYLRAVADGRSPLQDLYDLPRAQAMGKMVAVSFYFGEIDRAAFRAKFGVTVEGAFPAEVEWAVANGLMEDFEGRTLRLTPEGARHFNGVIALFFAPSIQRYLVERDPERAEDMHRARRRALAVAGGEGGPAPEAAHV